MIDILNIFGSNTAILGIASICGILGFILTIKVTIQTRNINRILQHNMIAVQYNKERISFQKAFEGHRVSIIEDGIKSDRILKEILKQTEEYRTKFREILTYSERIRLYLFLRILKKDATHANWNSICNYLAYFYGRLSKKEEKING